MSSDVMTGIGVMKLRQPSEHTIHTIVGGLGWVSGSDRLICLKVVVKRGRLWSLSFRLRVDGFFSTCYGICNFAITSPISVQKNSRESTLGLERAMGVKKKTGSFRKEKRFGAKFNDNPCGILLEE